MCVGCEGRPRACLLLVKAACGRAGIAWSRAGGHCATLAVPGLLGKARAANSKVVCSTEQRSLPAHPRRCRQVVFIAARLVLRSPSGWHYAGLALTTVLYAFCYGSIAYALGERGWQGERRAGAQEAREAGRDGPSQPLLEQEKGWAGRTV